MTISELVRIRMPREVGKVIADALQARRDIYDGKVRPDPLFVRLADPIFGALVYNMADLILDPDALDRDDKLKIEFKNLTASVDNVKALAVKIERAKLFENKRYPYQQEVDAWRATAHAMYETIGLLHELERNTATPQAKPDTPENKKAPTMNFYGGINQINSATEDAVIHATQNNGLNKQELETILTNLLQKIPSNITEQEKEQIKDSVDVIRTEVKNTQPKKSMIKTAIEGLMKFIKGSVEFATVVKSLVEFFKGFIP
ncbi:hypothetical protein FACS189468_6970 [Spirochaetia bacterium]|nr:hypothetical protein FACS189468_6970 [Spirochaetia bacterium]